MSVEILDCRYIDKKGYQVVVQFVDDADANKASSRGFFIEASKTLTDAEIKTKVNAELDKTITPPGAPGASKTTWRTWLNDGCKVEPVVSDVKTVLGELK